MDADLLGFQLGVSVLVTQKRTDRHTGAVPSQPPALLHVRDRLCGTGWGRFDGGGGGGLERRGCIPRWMEPFCSMGMDTGHIAILCDIECFLRTSEKLWWLFLRKCLILYVLYSLYYCLYCLYYHVSSV